MAMARRTKVRLWRWRRNPLRRRVDVVEAWVVLAAWIFAVVGGLLAGLVAANALTQSLDRQREERRPVPAVLAENAPGAVPSSVVGDERVWAKVRWKAPDGSAHTGRAKVDPETRAGSRTTVWTDRHGTLMSEPVSQAEAVLQATSAGLLAAMGGCGVVTLTAWGVRARIDRVRMRQWAVAWEQADLRWGGKTG
ncbi:hypothetical protein FE633_09390 [Streptomyces montanus]|uniref:Uncharacterized protein n=1 Tax=Streptomyces montanus TaxID=2580423 RepID=A0A5R9G4N9_9ACTN|nr:hypothetical protein [Streptomyces montanus]TLS46515.1 hypothetical protein FE633_09390 [Streptomyces montanus]